MSTTTQLEVKELIIDLKNFRTVPQKKESDAIKAMILIKSERFFAVLESILEDGYLPTENIIVLKEDGKFKVKEGNRRIASLKLIHGYVKATDFAIPANILEKIKNIDSIWKGENAKVPCTIFNSKEEDIVDKIIALAHAKGEKAGRDPWNSVAKARHNRDVKGASEFGLKLLEKYLKIGSNLNNQQKTRWSGEYNITVLDEALRKIHSKCGYLNVSELVNKYPKIQFLNNIEEILLNIGLEKIKFETIRSTQVDFCTSYGIVTPAATTSSNKSSSNTQQTSSTGSNQSSSGISSNQNSNIISSSISSSASSASTTKAYATTDPRNVAAILKRFNPSGNNRQKIVTLRDEIKKLKIKDNPIAFCFLLRSMFEISAKIYCDDKGISTVKSGGKDKTLVELLREITNHLTSNNTNKSLVKVFHGAMAEIGTPNRILSVTSMNQLVHSASFSILPNDICTLFSNIYPLLEAMN